MVSRRRFGMFSASAAAALAMPTDPLDLIAQKYVRLVLAVGLHDPDYVDAFYGPAAWKDEVGKAKPSPADIRKDALELLKQLDAAHPSAAAEELVRLRHRYLSIQLRSLVKRVEMLEGAKLSFDEESKALYDAVAPTLPASAFESTLAELATLIPGTGHLADRYAAYQQQFFIPAPKLDAVFRAAVDESRRRTRRHIRLPDNESFEIEYVKGQVWSAYNWYKGDASSLIQVNTDLPVEIGTIITLAAHEGYPGHHVYNALLEEHLVRKRQWIEFCVYPLFSPQSLIAEGSANYGVELAFPETGPRAFLARKLFPMAGLDPAKAEGYRRVKSLMQRLDHAGNQAARSYLDGKITKEDCQRWLTEYGLMPAARAAQRVRFIEKNRSYVINYNLGQDMIKAYMEKRGAPIARPAKAWREFEALLSSPRLPSGLL